jgi:putative Ca2+/H+ antiporter (TMEM165/GDT1 family)
MSFLAIFLVSFGLIFIAELGDKTQLMVFTLALRYGGRSVLSGAFLAFAVLSGSAALIGTGLGSLLDQDLLTRSSAGVFILFGVYMLFRKEEERGDQVKPSAKAGLAAAFSLIAMSEMGDKTQIATLLLSVKYQSVVPVFLGSLIALTCAALLGILIAGRLHRSIPAKYVSPISGTLFILIGAGTLLFHG